MDLSLCPVSLANAGRGQLQTCPFIQRRSIQPCERRGFAKDLALCDGPSVGSLSAVSPDRLPPLAVGQEGGER